MSGLQSRTIKKIELIRVPDDVYTRTNVTSETLRTIASYKVIFNDNLKALFGPLIAQAAPVKSSRISDLRWGIVFFDSSDNEVGSIWIDKLGTLGFVNKTPVSFGANLADRCRQLIRELP
jgi:hypothetical protein